MSIEVSVLGKSVVSYGLDVDISYTCPHCGESITETVCFERNAKNCVAVMDCHVCPECGESNDIEVDLY